MESSTKEKALLSKEKLHDKIRMALSSETPEVLYLLSKPFKGVDRTTFQGHTQTSSKNFQLALIPECIVLENFNFLPKAELDTHYPIKNSNFHYI